MLDGLPNPSLASRDHNGDPIACGENLLDVQARWDQGKVMSGHKTVMTREIVPLMCASTASDPIRGTESAGEPKIFVVISTGVNGPARAKARVSATPEAIAD